MILSVRGNVDNFESLLSYIQCDMRNDRYSRVRTYWNFKKKVLEYEPIFCDLPPCFICGTPELLIHY